METSSGTNHGCRLFVGNLHSQVTEDVLRTMIELFGTVEGVQMMRDRATGKSRGFAFVDMANQWAADRAMAQLNGKTINGRALKIRVGF